MKNLFLLAVLFCYLYAASACKKEKPAVVTGPVLTECLEAKLEEFKQLPWAVKIVRINRPAGTLYRLKDSYVDVGEPVLDEQCTLICTADCECDGSLIQCDGTFLDFPTETIWER